MGIPLAVVLLLIQKAKANELDDAREVFTHARPAVTSVPAEPVAYGEDDDEADNLDEDDEPDYGYDDDGEEVYRMDFPIYEQEEIPVTDAMEKAFGACPVRAFLGVDLVCVFEDEETVRTMTPDQTELSGLPGRIQNATARGKETDCVSRSFCPKVVIAEDPVCGSAHCQIAPYWAGVLGKRAITAYQASRRGGTLFCELTGNGRITIGGGAVLVAKSEVVAL